MDKAAFAARFLHSAVNLADFNTSDISNIRYLISNRIVSCSQYWPRWLERASPLDWLHGYQTSPGSPTSVF